MKILVDLQGLQPLSTEAMPHRFYALALTRSVVAALHGQGHRVIVLLDGRLQDDARQARQLFARIVEPEDFRLWHPPGQPIIRSDLGLQTLRALYRAFIADLEVDLLFVANLAAELPGLGSGDAASYKTAVAVHDLNVHDTASLDGRADLFITTSKWAERWYLDGGGVPDRSFRVEPKVAKVFTSSANSYARPNQLLAKWGLYKPYVLAPVLSADARAAEQIIAAFAAIPHAQREFFHLVIAHVRPHETVAPLVEELARRHLLSEGEVIAVPITDPAERAQFYQHCDLAVALHSDGDACCFSVLEAIASGVPLIAANHFAIPENVLNKEALFNPTSTLAMADKISQALGSADFRSALCSDAGKTAVTLSVGAADSAQRLLAALVSLARDNSPAPPQIEKQSRPRLAYVSPFPPHRSGVADYSAALVPELARHYEIELITDLTAIEDPLLDGHFTRRDCKYFLQHAQDYDRVLYHFGNSAFHEHMFELLSVAPGTVVLHDFFLGDLQAYLEYQGGVPHAWTKELYRSHGYGAVARRFQTEDASTTLATYPCSFGVVGAASGIIVHSSFALKLAARWYGNAQAGRFAQIPLLRKVSPLPSSRRRSTVRKELGILEDAFVVCSFGLLGPTKHNLRLLSAWFASPLANDPSCKLVFVGENDPGPYGAKVQALVDATPNGQASITGWTSAELFRNYLEVADLAVQLRTNSRGEMSAAVLDAMSYGVPTIINAHGSMADLPRDAVLMLEDDFSDADLAGALARLWNNREARQALSERAHVHVSKQHSPVMCAERYAQAIERFAAKSAAGRQGVIQQLKEGLTGSPQRDNDEISALASSISEALPSHQPAAQLFLDISAIVQHDLGTGIQRVIKSLLRALIDDPPEGFRIEPVYATAGRLGYRYAREYAFRFLGVPDVQIKDEWISFRKGDHFVGVDLLHELTPSQSPYLERMRGAGVKVYFVVYDLLPVHLPHRFPLPSAPGHARWLQTIASFDGALCISNAVANELSTWLELNAPESLRQGFNIRAFHLGANLDDGVAEGLPAGAYSTLAAIRAGTSFLMVGTIEPRKGHMLALKAFERLWQADYQVRLVIVGKAGWMVDTLVERLREHPERGHRLFWLERASDEYLDAVYEASTCLLAASEGEGFGLPLIEGAQHGLPILARDLPVFREVAGEHALYFAGDSAALAEAVARWIALWRRGLHPTTEGLSYLSWSESAKQFVDALLGN